LLPVTYPSLLMPHVPAEPTRSHPRYCPAHFCLFQFLHFFFFFGSTLRFRILGHLPHRWTWTRAVAARIHWRSPLMVGTAFTLLPLILPGFTPPPHTAAWCAVPTYYIHCLPQYLLALHTTTLATAAVCALMVGCYTALRTHGRAPAWFRLVAGT